MKAAIFTHITLMTLLAALMASFPLAAQDGNSPPPAPRKYTVQVLPGLGGLSGAFSINNRGWVGGLSNPPNDAYDHAILWRQGRKTDLGTLGGYNSSGGVNKNEIGWFVGNSETADQDPYEENFCGFICDPSTYPACTPPTHICKGFLWQSETNEMIALPPLPGGNNSSASGANNRHEIIGIAENGVKDSTCLAPQVFDFEGVVWRLGSDGKPFVNTRLDPLEGDTVSATTAINEKGDIVGASGPCASIGPGIAAHAVLWQDGRAIDLGNLGGLMNNGALMLNNRGQIVGVSDLPGDNVVHPFLWEKGKMQDLGTLQPNDAIAVTQSINDRGEVVGFSCPVSFPSNDCRAFHWQGGVMTDLNSVSVLPDDSPPLVIINAADINSSGEIAVQAIYPTVLDPFSAGGLQPKIVAAVLIPQR